MRKNKLLLLLALLLTAATGAWATDVYLVGNGTGNWLNDAVWDPGVAGNKMTEQNGVYSITFTNVDANSELLFKFAINGTWDVNYGCTSWDANELNKTLSNIEKSGNNFMFGLTETADVTISFNPSEMTYMISTKGMKVGDDASSGPKHLITATYRERTCLLEQPLPYATTVGELFEAVTGEPFSGLISSMSAVEMPLTGITSRNTSIVSIGEFNGASTPVTVIADGETIINLIFGSYVQGIPVSATSPLYAYMKDGVKDAGNWTVKVGEGEAQALPIGGLTGDGSETVTLKYNGRLKVKGVKATSDAAPAAGNSFDLSTLTADYEAKDGDVLTGETTSYKVTIAAGATVTLDGVNISGGSYCIKCAGDATIILKDGSTNTLNSTCDVYPALSIGDDNTTLTIQGSTGVLNVTSGNYCAGIGGGYKNADKTCGNIRIEGGVITAQGGGGGAGIGTDCGEAHCGDIIITGGTITANGGTGAAGIGTGSGSSQQVVCGDITIANTVTKVTATKGAGASHSIGKGDGSKATCGTVTIGGTVYWQNNAAVGDGATYLATSPLNYDPTAPAAATVTTAPTGAAVVGVGKTTALVSGGVADGGTLWYAVTTTNTKPASTDGFSDAVPTAKDITASGKVYVWYYVKGDDTHSDSEIAATAIEVPVADIVWDATNVSDLEVVDDAESYTKEGIKLSCNAEDVNAVWYEDEDPTMNGISLRVQASGGFTFTAPTGKKFTKIEMNAVYSNGWDGANLGTGWKFVEDDPNNIYKATWTGSASSTVDLLKDVDDFGGEPVKSIAFYLSE